MDQKIILMKKILILTLMTFVLITTALNSCKTEEKEKAIDRADMDLKVNPATDFDNYANGGWKVNNPLPADKSRFGTFDKLRDAAEKQLQSLFTKVTSEKHEDGTVGQKIADMYNMGMDSATIEKQGAATLKPYLDEIATIKTSDDVQAMVNKYQVSGNGTLFAFFSSPDNANSNWVIAHLYQAGLGMSDRDYYLNDDPRSKEIRGEYLIHIGKMFKLSGNDEATSKVKAEKIMSIETQLAKASMTRLDTRDPNKTDHKMDLAGLTKLSPGYDWSKFFSAVGLPDQKEINVGMPEFFKEIGKMISEVPVDDWKAYLEWNVINSSASYLSSAFVDQNFNFYGKVMQGQEKIRDRWKRVQGVVSGSLSEAIGQLYVAEYFPPQAKERMVKLVENLRVSLGQRIDQLTWMSDETKLKAHEKLAAIRVKIGYPDKWRDYSKLEIKKDSYLDNVLRAWKFEFDFDRDKINKPVDKSEWLMPPQMVNAYYHPMMNEIVFPAAILQPPFFYLDADDAVNYGAIGVVIGHEITHGFDDQGRKYDKDGNLNDWWTEEDGKRFEEHTKILVNQYNAFTVLDTIHADGSLSLGENIADLGGLNISYQAYKLASKETKPIDGFTPDQRFYLAYAHLWASNVRDKEILRLTKEDVHSLGRFRVLGPLRNVPNFQKAFNIKEGDYMYLPENERAVIW
jgi:putative endopeptidase